MPYLMLDTPPPTSKDVRTAYSLNQRRSQDSNIHSAPLGSSDSTINGSNVLETSNVTNIYPLMKLDTERITDAIAGRLATSLLAHVLFLKNQVPLPIIQLGRLSSAKTTSRAFKQRTELLNSYDTISSHLETTFSALSTALARSSEHVEGKLNKVYLGYLIGPSISTSKAKVILGIDGLEARVWGTRANVHSVDDRADRQPISDDGAREEEIDCDHLAGDDGEHVEQPEDSEDEEEEDEEDDDAEASASEDEESSSSDTSPYQSHTHELNFLQNADRLLSRTLANADVNGNGINSEMAPTQTHIVLRAPRRFTHPAWIPRQNISAALDAVLGDFLRGSGVELPIRPTEKMRKESNVEGVWITTRMGLQKYSCSSSGTTIPSKDGVEEDDMIWWSWDGKLVGFADW